MAKRTMIVVVHPLFNEAECFNSLDSSVFHKAMIYNGFLPYGPILRDPVYISYKKNLRQFLVNRSDPALLLEDKRYLKKTAFLEKEGYVDKTIKTEKCSGHAEDVTQLETALKGYKNVILIGQYFDGCLDEANEDLEALGKNVILEETCVYLI